MEEELKVLGCKFVYFWIFFIILQGFIIVGISSTFYTEDWAIGLGMKSSLREITYNNEDYNIISQIEEICEDSPNSFHCKASKRLLEGEYMYIIFSGISSFSSLIWIICSILLSKQKNYYISGCICGFLAFFSYILAVFFWIVKAQVGLNGCKKNLTTASTQKLCFESGFKFNLYLIAYIPFVLYVFFLLGGITLKKLKIGYMSLQDESSATPARGLDETSIHTINRAEIVLSSN